MRDVGCAYDARTMHARLTPVARRFSYRLFSLYLDIDCVGEAQTKLFSYNRANVFAFLDSDHGDRSGAPLRPWAIDVLREAGVEIGDGAIRLLTFPRLFGYVFNPLSVFFAFDESEALRGVIYEVNNTFGETHAYVFATDGGACLHRHRAAKRFHVSPFLDVRGEYRFAVSAPGERLTLSVENFADGAFEHRATLTGQRAPLSDARLLRTLLELPFMTLGVTAAIHWQALKILAAKITYRRKPAPPPTALTIGEGTVSLPKTLNQS